MNKGKKTLFFLFVLILLVSFVSAYNCNNETDVSKVPCLYRTKSIQCSTTYSYNLTDAISSLQLQEGNLTNVTDGTYRFVFTQGIGDYDVFVCENNIYDGSVSVGEYEKTYDYTLYLVILVSWVLLIIGLYYEENYFLSFAGILMIILGVYVIVNGLDYFNNFVTVALASIHIGMGAYVFIRSNLDVISNMMR